MQRFTRLGLLSIAIAIAPVAAFAQEQAPVPTDAEVIAALHAKEAEIGPGKHDFIEQQLAITAEEGAKFWPIYEAHQEALKKFNQRRIDNILAYAKVYKTSGLTDAEAHRLATEALAIEREEIAELEQTYDKVRAVLSGIKAVHYLQVEGKLRALVRFQQAASVPIVEDK